MQPKGANKNIVDQAIFSKEGPNLNSPAETKIPNVIPKKYKLRNKKNKWIPRSNMDMPKRGDVSKIAGMSPIKALIKAVIIKEIIISPILIGAINKFVKFLLHISSKNNMLNPILVLKRKSYRIAQVKITPTALL